MLMLKIKTLVMYQFNYFRETKESSKREKTTTKEKSNYTKKTLPFGYELFIKHSLDALMKGHLNT